MQQITHHNAYSVLKQKIVLNLVEKYISLCYYNKKYLVLKKELFMNGENTIEYISLITFIAGYLISEIIRRINRAESFNTQIFNKRLDVFSELYSTWNRAYMDISNFIEAIIDGSFSENDDLDETHFILVSPLLKILDEKEIYFIWCCYNFVALCCRYLYLVFYAQNVP